MSGSPAYFTLNGGDRVPVFKWDSSRGLRCLNSGDYLCSSLGSTASGRVYAVYGNGNGKRFGVVVADDGTARLVGLQKTAQGVRVCDLPADLEVSVAKIPDHDALAKVKKAGVLITPRRTFTGEITARLFGSA